MTGWNIVNQMILHVEVHKLIMFSTTVPTVFYYFLQLWRIVHNQTKGIINKLSFELARTFILEGD